MTAFIPTGAGAAGSSSNRGGYALGELFRWSVEKDLKGTGKFLFLSRQYQRVFFSIFFPFFLSVFLFLPFIFLSLFSPVFSFYFFPFVSFFFFLFFSFFHLYDVVSPTPGEGGIYKGKGERELSYPCLVTLKG